MSRERMALIGLAALLVAGLLFGAVSSGIANGQRDAWMQGYTLGRLTAAAGVDGAVAPQLPYAVPYAAYGPGYGPRGPGFGGVLLILLATGALFFVSRLVMRERWRAWAAMQGAAEGSPQPGPGAPWHPGAPWLHGRRCGSWGVPWDQAQAAQSERAAQAQGAAAADQPAAEQPSAER